VKSERAREREEHEKHDRREEDELHCVNPTMRQVTTATLRVQSKAHLLKTGTQRQSELVALLYRYSRLMGRGCL
jgi:hypothetical protein